MGDITPDAQITNLLAVLTAEARKAPYAGHLAVLRSIATQLEAAWQQYQGGTLPALTDDTPF